MFHRHYVGSHLLAARLSIVDQCVGAAQSFRVKSMPTVRGHFGVAGLNKDDRAALPSDDAEKKSPLSKRRRADASNQDGRPQIGRALRSVYDETVSEAIPSEMLDLLGKLD